MIFIMILMLLGNPTLGLAQTDTDFRISEPVVDAFPRVTLYVQVVDQNGRRVANLPDASFRLFEDNELALDLQLDETLVGARLVFVLNTTSELRIRDTLGRSRFDLVRSELLDWWALPDFTRLGIDDYSIVTAAGTLISHTQSIAELASTLDNLSPDFADQQSAYRLLFDSLDLTTARPPVAGMPTALIFFTALPRSPLDLPVDNIIARAQGTNTAIFPVLIATPEAIEQPEAEPLVRIAEETGGSLLIFQEQVGLSSLAQTIAGQRLQYKLDYTSPATTPGTHTIRLEFSVDGQELGSLERSYILDLQPADVIVLEPPEHITRATDDPTTPLNLLPPTELQISFLTTFSDQFDRPLGASQLLVDGQVVDQRTDPPYSPLNWDLSGYLESDLHQLQVRVVDSIGMESLSSVHPVSLEVVPPLQGLAAIRPAFGYMLAALGVLLAGVILAAGVISLGQRDPFSRYAREPAAKIDITEIKASLQREPPEGPAEAFLHPVSDAEIGLPSIPMTGVDLLLGTDPSLAATPIQHPSVDRLHARLIRQADGGYILRDQGSTAGTWVNFERVPDKGVRIKHGDLIHIGMAEFRFELVDAPPPRPILVRRVDDDIVDDSDSKLQDEP